jgi:NADPH:quinone reductase-like Zn-dependent oxidoreductase
MIQYGLLVLKHPFVPGCDAGGVVVNAGKNAISALGNQFKEGDKVFGCTRLGSDKYSTFQEYVSGKQVSVS